MGRSGGLREVLISALNTPTWTHQEEEHVSATPRPRVGPAVWGPLGMHRFLANNPRCSGPPSSRPGRGFGQGCSGPLGVAGGTTGVSVSVSGHFAYSCPLVSQRHDEEGLLFDLSDK